jgi:predicted GIY-YIG superfamily endonuclease
MPGRTRTTTGGLRACYMSLSYHCVVLLDSVSRVNMHKGAHDTPSRSGFCCYILQSERWPKPYTGKTCDLARRLHRHNHPSRRSRAYTKGKGPWRIAAAVLGLRSNRQSVWLERALKRHAKHRARPAGLSAIQSAILNAARVSSRPRLWWRGGAGQPVPSLRVHVFKCALVSWEEAEVALSSATLPVQEKRLEVCCHRQRSFSMLETPGACNSVAHSRPGARAR